MPRAIPDYVPSVIVEKIREKNLWGLTDFAKAVKIPKTTMYHFWQFSEHTAFFQFKAFCDGINTTVDDGANVLAVKNDIARMHVWDKLIRKKYGTYKECAAALDMSQDYLTDLINGGTGKKILTLYKPQADKLGLTLEELATILGDGK